MWVLMCLGRGEQHSMSYIKLACFYFFLLFFLTYKSRVFFAAKYVTPWRKCCQFMLSGLRRENTVSWVNNVKLHKIATWLNWQFVTLSVGRNLVDHVSYGTAKMEWRNKLLLATLETTLGDTKVRLLLHWKFQTNSCLTLRGERFK